MPDAKTEINQNAIEKYRETYSSILKVRDEKEQEELYALWCDAITSNPDKETVAAYLHEIMTLDNEEGYSLYRDGAKEWAVYTASELYNKNSLSDKGFYDVAHAGLAQSYSHDNYTRLIHPKCFRGMTSLFDKGSLSAEEYIKMSEKILDPEVVGPEMYFGRMATDQATTDVIEQYKNKKISATQLDSISDKAMRSYGAYDEKVNVKGFEALKLLHDDGHYTEEAFNEKIENIVKSGKFYECAPGSRSHTYWVYAQGEAFKEKLSQYNDVDKNKSPDKKQKAALELKRYADFAITSTHNAGGGPCAAVGCEILETLHNDGYLPEDEYNDKLAFMTKGARFNREDETWLVRNENGFGPDTYLGERVAHDAQNWSVGKLTERFNQNLIDQTKIDDVLDHVLVEDTGNIDSLRGFLRDGEIAADLVSRPAAQIISKIYGHSETPPEGIKNKKLYTKFFEAARYVDQQEQKAAIASSDAWRNINELTHG